MMICIIVYVTYSLEMDHCNDLSRKKFCSPFFPKNFPKFFWLKFENHHFWPKFEKKIINFCSNLKNHHFLVIQCFCHMLLCRLQDRICLLCCVICCCVIDTIIDTLVSICYTKVCIA